MHTPGRWRRRASWIVRWGGLACVAAILCVFIASLWVYAWCERGPPSSGNEVTFGLSPGCVFVHRTHRLWLGEDDGPRPTPFTWRLGWRNASWSPAWPETWWVDGVPGDFVGWTTYLPLWMLLIPALLSTMLAWWPPLRAMKRARAGLCPSCAYSLSGLAIDTPCPECGHTAERATT